MRLRRNNHMALETNQQITICRCGKRYFYRDTAHTTICSCGYAVIKGTSKKPPVKLKKKRLYFGDLLAKVIDAIGGRWYKRQHLRKHKKICPCSRRQQKLNALDRKLSSQLSRFPQVFSRKLVSVYRGFRSMCHRGHRKGTS